MNTLSPQAIDDMCGPNGLGPYIPPPERPAFNPHDPIHVAARRYVVAHDSFTRANKLNRATLEQSGELNRSRVMLKRAVEDAREQARGD